MTLPLVLVTGAGRGIGAACAEHLARGGAHVVLASRTRNELDSVAERIHESGGRATVVPTDLADPAQVTALFETIDTLGGALTGAVLAAATLVVQPFTEVDLHTFDRVMAINVRSVFQCSQLAFERMDAGGSIVTFSSLGGIRSTEKFPGLSTYVISKSAIVGLTESLAVAGRERGIRVNCIAPGAVDTKMLRDAAPFLKTVTLPEHIAPLCAFLMDDAQSGSVSGSTLEVFSNA